MSDDPKNPQVPGWKPMGGGPARQPQFVIQQAENLGKLKELLEGVVGQKRAEIMSLQEKLLRLKYGGGQ